MVWSVYEVGLGVSVPFPSAADAGFLLAIPLAVAGVFAFTSAPSRLATRGEALLAGTIIALSLLFVAWALGLGKVYDMSTASPPVRLIGLAYPVGDIITITVLVLALRRARRSELGSLFLLLGGLAAAALADSAFAYLTASGSYGAIGSFLDAGWVIGYLMIALAPIWPATDNRDGQSRRTDRAVAARASLGGRGGRCRDRDRSCRPRPGPRPVGNGPGGMYRDPAGREPGPLAPGLALPARERAGGPRTSWSGATTC